MFIRDKILPVWKQYKQALELITCLAAYSIVRLNSNDNNNITLKFRSIIIQHEKFQILYIKCFLFKKHYFLIFNY